MNAGGRGGAAAPGRPAAPGLAAVLLVVLLSALAAHAGLLSVPFVGDDHFTLDKTRDAPFLSVWAPREPVSGFYRPWSRELHTWTLQRLSGANELPFHAVSFALWLAVALLYFALARRLGAGRARRSRR